MNADSKEGKLSRKEREFLSRRREILEAAANVFARKGYHGAAMSEIAKSAEFSTGSLYNFFKNKEELYFTLLKDKIEALESELEEVYNSDADMEKILESYIKKIMSFFQKEGDFFRIFAEQRTSFESSAKGHFQDVITEKHEVYLSRMVDLMSRGIDEGLLKPYSPAELAMSLLGLIHAFLFVSINSPEGAEPQEKVGQLLDIFFYGTRQRPDREEQ
ncbi:MAG: TetR/AcrR family transcriptional regulator [bacterium]